MAKTSSGVTNRVTMEVLKNAFISVVDQMAEQLLRTCYSFVIFNRDFSSCLCDAQGNTVTQGTKDIASHVGTLHFTAKAVLEYFGEDLKPGDVIAINDPYVGGTHFNDVRIVRPVFVNDVLIALLQVNGHWADVGGSAPGSFDISAREHFGEGLRLTPVKLWSEGAYRRDVANMIVSNMRVPADRLGDLEAQAEAARIGEIALLRLVSKYGVETVLLAFDECQNYAERLLRARLRELPTGVWETDDYLDEDPDRPEGLARIHVKMMLDGDSVHYDLEGTDPPVGSILNGAFGTSYSALVAGTKTFFPDIPLNSGIYRVVSANLPSPSIANTPWPRAVTGFASGAYEKIMNACFELWSQILPERALACSFNLEYVLMGGWDGRRAYQHRQFMAYDWMVGGWGGRNGRDGINGCAPVFGVGLAIQPFEGYERLCPIVTTKHELLTDSGGPGKWRGGCGVEKGARIGQTVDAVLSFCSDRSRSITWGIAGGYVAVPQDLWMNPGTDHEVFCGSTAASMPVHEGDVYLRCSSGGGGYGDPLDRDPALVREDVADGYVSIERARKDYGVVIETVDRDLAEYRVDESATIKERKFIRNNRERWYSTDPRDVRQMWLDHEIDSIDCVRRFGVILDLGTKVVLPRTTEQFRATQRRRMVLRWRADTETPGGVQ